MSDNRAAQDTSAITSRDELPSRGRRGSAPEHCGWCGRRLDAQGTVGRRRRYCGHACRQRAYERRTAVQRGGLPADAVVLSETEVAALQDRLFQLRCAAEDIVTAAREGANPEELRSLADELARSAQDLERLR
ncbi:hypothetical protein [Saccharomonospora xinjiangensis]|uniref:Uncharacterized protein n=1 Tax=Saccharomonospora xinjiangensis XJ-54 TaxID=882086 RepID=I0V8M2_9PSEU|nr:hypothetical protein [Saccharomonospora xinjiangensis]EID56475.1 hypothetical protein SacxiDRAFT_4294 [Saccharomonospora xinjiangensis XJ-54]